MDSGAAGSWYKLSAVDWNGNESVFAVLGPAQTTNVHGDVPVSFALDGVRPNPVIGRSLVVGFALPIKAAARLELIDVMGRVVVGREVGSMGVGPHVVDLSSGRRLPAGLYLVRLTQGAESRVTRVTVLN